MLKIEVKTNFAYSFAQCLVQEVVVLDGKQLLRIASENPEITYLYENESLLCVEDREKKVPEVY